MTKNKGQKRRRLLPLLFLCTSKCSDAFRSNRYQPVALLQKEGLHIGGARNGWRRCLLLPSLSTADGEEDEPELTVPLSPSFAGAPEAAASVTPSEWLQKTVLSGVEPTPDVWAFLTVYFVQGALGLARLATTFFLKDDLHLGPAESAALLGVTSIPWVIKPVYGFLSDSFPILGYRRRSYLILAGFMGSAAWIALSSSAVVSTPTQALVALTITSLGVALSDVVVDSLVVAKTRDTYGGDPATAGALQSLCWGE